MLLIFTNALEELIRIYHSPYQIYQMTYTSDRSTGPRKLLSTDYLTHAHAPIQRGRGGGGRGPENHKNIGFLRNTGPEPRENYYATKSATKPPAARQRYMACRWRADGGIWILPPLIKKKSKLGPL